MYTKTIYFIHPSIHRYSYIIQPNRKIEQKENQDRNVRIRKQRKPSAAAQYWKDHCVFCWWFFILLQYTRKPDCRCRSQHCCIVGIIRISVTEKKSLYLCLMYLCVVYMNILVEFYWNGCRMSWVDGWMGHPLDNTPPMQILFFCAPCYVNPFYVDSLQLDNGDMHES